MKRKILILLAILLIFNINPIFAQSENKQNEAWEREIKNLKDYSTEKLTTSYLLGDFASGKILEEKNIDEPVAIASISKLISIYVVMDEIAKGNISKNDLVKIDKETSEIGGSSYKLEEGMEVSVEDLMIASLVVSGNDAVTALAKYVAGTENNFVIMMQNKLHEIGIEKFQIINSSGLPDYNNDRQNMLTVREIFDLSRSIVRDYPEILEYTKTKKIVEKNRNFESENTNPILGEIFEIDGLKTGYTDLAGRCIVATGMEKKIENERADMRLIGITMGSKSDAARYVAIKKLMEHGFSDYEYKILGSENSPIKEYEDESAVPKNFSIYAKESTAILCKKDDSLSVSENIDDYELPIRAGEKIGELIYYLNGEEKFKTDLIVKESIKKTSWAARLNRLYFELFEKVNMKLNG